MGTSFVFFLRPQYFFFKQYIGTSGNELIHNFPSADNENFEEAPYIFQYDGVTS